MCSQHVCVRLDNALSRKGLDARQAAFTNRKYKSHHRVGLLADIITAIAQDAQRASSIHIFELVTVIVSVGTWEFEIVSICEKIQGRLTFLKNIRYKFYSTVRCDTNAPILNANGHDLREERPE